MKNNTRTAIIVEGTAREPQLLDNLIRIFFNRHNYTIIQLPVGQNIYMLWEQMKRDEFVTDIIEVIREYSELAAEKLEGLERDDFAEVFLFFDYDGHQDNLSNEHDGRQVLQQMLEMFNDETDNGKLYISYPMVEAMRDYLPGSCKPLTDCLWKNDQLDTYKMQSAVNNLHTAIRDYTYMDWCDVLDVFAMRVSCLFGYEEVISFEKYREHVSPLTIYQQQNMYITNGEVFVLSAFPEFLLEYYKKSFWNSHIKLRFLGKDCHSR